MNDRIAWVDQDRCVGCGECVSVCPVDAISMVGGKARVDEDCTGCGACIRVCPEGAMQLVARGELVPVEESSAPAAYRPSPVVEGAGAAAVAAGVSLLAKAGTALARAVRSWLTSTPGGTGQAGTDEQSYGGGGRGAGGRQARRRRRGGRG
jgi:MinD superfamily P-loop ATPase